MQERTQTAVILTVNLAAASLAAAAVFEDEKEQGSMIVYNFCMSRSTQFKSVSPMPKFRILENISVLASLLGKLFLYVKAWTKISLLSRRHMPEETSRRCKELSGLLLGKLLYSVAELSPLFFVVVTHILSLHFTGINTDKIKYCVIFTYPGLSLVLLPSITIFTTPSLRSGLKGLVKCATPHSQSSAVQPIPANHGFELVSQPCHKELALASASQLSPEDLALKSVTPCAAAAGDDMEEIGKGDGPVNSISSTIAGVANDDNYGHVKALLKSCE